MKIVETERVYCFDITERQMGIALKRDDRARETYDQVSGRYMRHGNLLDRLCKIKNVREVAYDHWFGPHIFVRLENPDTYQETLEKVKKEIAQYVR